MCDFVSQVGLIGLVQHDLRMAIVAGARYWITRPDEAEIAVIVGLDRREDLSVGSLISYQVGWH
jgi:hypothetical protein